MRRFLMMTSAALVLTGCGREAEAPDPRAEALGLADSILTALPEAEPGEFPTPGAAVTFLLEQVRADDFEEAIRVFPVRRRFETLTMEVYARRTGVYDYRRAPRPGEDLRNALLALHTYGQVFDSLRDGYLQALHPDTRAFDTLVLVPKDDETAFATTMEELRAAFDPSQLEGMEWEVTRVSTQPPLDVAEEAMGVEEKAALEVFFVGWEEEGTVVVECGRIGENWAVLKRAG